MQGGKTAARPLPAPVRRTGTDDGGQARRTGDGRLAARNERTGRALAGIASFQEIAMLKFVGGTIGFIFLIGLLVIIGILMLIF